MVKGSDSRSGVMVMTAVAVIGATVGARAAGATTVTGAATALQARVDTLAGPTTAALAATGALVDEGDARAAELSTGSIAAVGAAKVLHAFTMSAIDGTAGDEVVSEASLSDVTLNVAGNSISAAFVMAQAVAPLGEAETAWSAVEGFAINGVSILPTGAANQTVSLPGLTVVLNELQQTGDRITVNAIHISSSLDGTDVIVGSATAGVSP